MTEHVSEPYRTAPPANPRFFVSEDRDTFVDLGEVVVAYWRDEGDRETDTNATDKTPYAEVWVRGGVRDDDGFKLFGDIGRQFMSALIAYRAAP